MKFSFPRRTPLIFACAAFLTSYYLRTNHNRDGKWWHSILIFMAIYWQRGYLSSMIENILFYVGCGKLVRLWWWLQDLLLTGDSAGLLELPNLVSRTSTSTSPRQDNNSDFIKKSLLLSERKDKNDNTLFDGDNNIEKYSCFNDIDCQSSLGLDIDKDTSRRWHQQALQLKQDLLVFQSLRPHVSFEEEMC